MGRNKLIRKKIQGQRDNIEEHYRKVREENAKPRPNQDVIRKWLETDIPKAERIIEKLERKLPGGKKK